MAATTSSLQPFPIFYNQDVHGFYIKQKSEFHFQQKSDNDFLMFLLDTAVRVISIVQHLAPVIEAVSDASGDEIDDFSPGTPNSSILSVNTMDVDNMVAAPSPQPHVPPLSAELEQINQEITAAQISGSKPLHQIRQPILHTPQSYTTQPRPSTQKVHDVTRDITMSTRDITMSTRDIVALSPEPIPVEDVPVMQTVGQSSAPLGSTSAPSHSNYIADSSDEADIFSTAPPAFNAASPGTPATNVPPVQMPSSAQPSENMPTSLPHDTQPVAEAAEVAAGDAPELFKTEQPVPEVIEIKEEIAEASIPASSSALLSPGTLQQLMSSISSNDENMGLQNFVTTATPSNLPPSFLDRSSTNPLSMLGSLNSGDGPGPSGLMNVPNISESMMKNINDAGLNVSSIKGGQANPIRGIECPICFRVFHGKYSGHVYKRHYKAVHLKIQQYSCDFCCRKFAHDNSRKRHAKICPANPLKRDAARDLTMATRDITMTTRDITNMVTRHMDHAHFDG